MCKVKVTEKYAILQMIEALGFCRFVFRKCGVDLERGIILVVENLWQAGEIADALCETTDAVMLDKRGRKQKLSPMNFQMGIHVYGKSDDKAWIKDFLFEKDFLPVVLVAGIVPEILFENGYIFKLGVTGYEIFEFREMYEKMRSSILKYHDTLCYELKKIETSRIAKKYLQIEQSNAIRMIIATGLIWKIVIRIKNDEETTDAWMAEYCYFLIKQLRHMDDFTGRYTVLEAVRRCIFTTVEANKMQILHINETTKTERAILADEEFYYFPEALLKEICTPLTDTISFLQLKSEMYADGILVCNDGHKKNYTVKVTCFDSVNKKYIRKRFLKLKKECLLTDSGMSLEDWTELKYNEEVNENVDKDWRN